MPLTGCFSRLLDEKLRVAIPKKLRTAMGCEADAVLYVAPGTDSSLAVYTEESFNRLAERLNQVSPTRQDVRAFARLFYGQAQQVDLDLQGRFRIPPELAQLAQLQKEVMLVGVQDHLELWAAEHWKAYIQEKQAQYDQIAEAAFGTSGS